MTVQGAPEASRPKPITAILHYSAAPVVGGVEAVISAHAGLFLDNGYPVTVVAGNARADSLPQGTGFIHIPEMDTQHPQIVALNPALENGRLPSEFAGLVERLADALRPQLTGFDNLIVHNIFSKHFNLPLTAALARLLDEGVGGNWIAWCHDLTWTSPNSRHKVHPGYPWDLLRRPHPRLCYITISKERLVDLAGLLELPAEELHVVYNGVDPAGLLGLTEIGIELAERLGWLDSDLNLLMPVRVTQAKNVEYAIKVTAAFKHLGLRVKLALTGPPDPHDAESMAYFRSLQGLRQEAGVEQELRFVFESGPDPETPFTIPLPVVGDLFRLADLIFMPSRREGFGMPVLEAGLAGVPLASTSIPAAVEIGENDVFLFSEEDDPIHTAGRILAWLNDNPASRLKRRVRREYTWQAIFKRDIEPLLINKKIPPSLDLEPFADSLAKAGPLWLFLDYDGTLADFALTPDHVLPDPELIELLERLARLPEVRITVISGRRLSHIQELLPIDGLILAGSYGLELQTMDGPSHPLDYAEIRPVIEEVKPGWEKLLAGRQGFYLEDKGWTLAIHARFAADPEAEQVLQAALDEVRDKPALESFRILGGHRFLEIGPRLANKGHTVEYLLDRFPFEETGLLYIGDDDKDEEAFQVIRAHSGTALVTADPPRPSQADYRLQNPSQVRRFLSRLADKLEKSKVKRDA